KQQSAISPSQVMDGVTTFREQAQSSTVLCCGSVRSQVKPKDITMQVASLDNSQLIAQDEAELRCPVCDKCFPFRSRVLEHQKIHLSSRDLQCDLCTKSFKRTSELYRHYRNTHADKVDLPSRTPSKQVRESEACGNPCPDCDKCFRTWKALRLHRGFAHQRPERYLCEECARTFSRKKDVSRHRKTVHGTDAKYDCDICGRIFNRPDSLRRHIRAQHNCK
ncbi:hypothetical protein CRM22_005575, partial [Opisthorchis felineus]